MSDESTRNRGCAVAGGRIAEIGEGFGQRQRKRSTPGRTGGAGLVDGASRTMAAPPEDGRWRPPGGRASATATMGDSGVGLRAIPLSRIVERLIQLMEGVEVCPEAGVEHQHPLGLGELSG